jgi:DNA repair exonuclease SbcCD ATPase subunit
MRIIHLKINNILNLKAIDVHPQKNVNKVSGKNGAGKSNFLETIRFALLGKRAMPKEPIREGQKQGDIVVELDDYIVTVKITKNGEYWQVTDKEGRPVKSPQTLLKEIVGPISFDPLALLDEDPKKLRAVLLELLGVDLDKYDTEIKRLRDERQIEGRSLKLNEAALTTLPYYTEAPKEEISISELHKKLAEAGLVNNAIDKAGNELDSINSEITSLEKRVQFLKEQKENRIKYLQENAVVDTAVITEKMENIETVNQQVRANKAYNIAKKRAQESQGVYNKFTEKIEQLELVKDDTLKKAKMPIPGLGVDEEGVTFTDEKHGTKPISQINTAKRIEIGMAIYMAKNPDLKVMFAEGDKFDKETEKAVEAAVKDADFQLFCEVVDEETESGIYLIDGTVRE